MIGINEGGDRRTRNNVCAVEHHDVGSDSRVDTGHRHLATRNVHGYCITTVADVNCTVHVRGPGQRRCATNAQVTVRRKREGGPRIDRDISCSRENTEPIIRKARIENACSICIPARETVRRARARDDVVDLTDLKCATSSAHNKVIDCRRCRQVRHRDRCSIHRKVVCCSVADRRVAIYRER